MRLFYAVSIPPDIRHELYKAAESMGSLWRPTPEDQLHITLAFMENAPQEALAKIAAAGEFAALNIKPFNVKLGVARGFPNDANPRVWVITTDSIELEKLASSLKVSLTPWVDQKPFKGHLTIARPRKPFAVGKPFSFDYSWIAESFELIESRITSKGAIHTRLNLFYMQK